MAFGPSEGKDYVWIENCGMAIKITGGSKDDLTEIKLQGQTLSHIGEELARLVSPSDQNMDYLREVVPALLGSGSKNGKVKSLVAEYGKIDEYDVNEGNFSRSEILKWVDMP